MKVKTVYLAGPMEGDPEYRDKFAAAEQALYKAAQNEKISLVVFNPVEIMRSLDDAGVGYETMLDCYCNLARKCDAIAMLPGWSKPKPKGARAELEQYCESKHCYDCAILEVKMIPNPKAKGEYRTIIKRCGRGNTGLCNSRWLTETGKFPFGRIFPNPRSTPLKHP